MPRLKSRSTQIPEGMFVYVPETRWRSTPWASFDVIVSELIQHRLGNPALTAKFKWSTDRATVENEVDSFIANVCAQMSWTNYIVTESAPPPSLKPPQPTDLSQLAVAGAAIKNIWAGIKTIGEWIDSNAPVVTQELANARAAVCVACPKNGDGDFGKWFIAPAAASIKRQVEKINARGLATPDDAKLGVCEACTCSLRVKTWIPIEFVKTHTSDQTLDALRTATVDKAGNPMLCWQIAELAKA